MLHPQRSLDDWRMSTRRPSTPCLDFWMSTLSLYQLIAFPKGTTAPTGAPITVILEKTPLSTEQRAHIARKHDGITAFAPETPPEQLPAVFFDPIENKPQGAISCAFFDALGERPDGEAAYIAVFRAFALSGKTVARRVLLDTPLGIVQVQEEVFRRPPQAQVWIEQPLPTLATPWLDLKPFAETLSLPATPASSISGTTLMIRLTTQHALEQVTLESIQPLLHAGFEDVVVFTTSPSNPFIDLAVRHFARRGAQETSGSVKVNVQLGRWVWELGLQKTYLVLEQGTPARCRLSVWLEADEGTPTRISVGGQIHRLDHRAISLEELLA